MCGLSGQEVKEVVGGLFFIGLVVVFVSLLGCAGAYFESRCFIIFYMCFLIVIILGQLFITVVLLIRREKAQCCGRLTSNEWRNNTVIESLGGTDIYPCSCFNATCPVILARTHSFGNGSDIYKTGCEKVLVDWLEMNIIVIFGMDVGLFLVQILQFIFGIQTFKCIGLKTRELHPNNLLDDTEENPAAQPEHQEYSMENNQFDSQTYDPQMDSGYYHHGGYVDGNYDNPEFYPEQDNSQI
uniref:Si:ch73-139j3.4 n=1 Tax=Cyprinus carpio carpio TaxID=630221 RepID=A0A9J7Y700_CYPCA